MLESVKRLKKEISQSNEHLKVKYERTGDVDLAAFFLLCKKKFREINSAYYKRSIIYITNDDDPLNGDNQKKFAALNEAKTFEPSDISFEIATMTETFDYTKFYNELFHLYAKPPSVEYVYPDKDCLVEKLLSSIVFRYTKLRYNFYPFKNDYSRFLKVMRVNFIRPVKIYNTHRASRDGKMVIKIKQPPVARNTPQYRVPISTGDAIQLDLKDKYDIYGNALPLGFHLQYVADRQIDDDVIFINKVSILLLNPKEELHNYFEQFWQYCTAKNKVLVCIKKYRQPSALRYVELIPKYARKQKLFLIKDMNFCEEARFPKTVETAEPREHNATEQQRAVIEELTDKLEFDYDPRMFINPIYGKKKAYVKAKLLDLPREEVEDPSANTEGINEQIREIVDKIERTFEISGIPQAKKRKAPAASGSGRARKVVK